MICYSSAGQCGDVHRFTRPPVKAQFCVRIYGVCLPRDYSLLGIKCKLKGRNIIIHKLEFKVIFTADFEKDTVNVRINSEKKRSLMK